ncbi:hypothetical protein OUY26_06405 [Levilactobacillus brevis]|uniref:hypothetical protein n=1 Tax=Levilactobacillus brevis TaxID=1580 RepID=UPI0022786216|nr:hypothetical protein [Levilactobacillus brevis]WAE43991.1 hypothetical protein OUY26_06405 [Levilactobacillus brevis]
MTGEKIAIIIFAVLAVGLLSLVLMFMKSALWAVGFPIAFAGLGLLCYGIEHHLERNRSDNHDLKTD